MNLFKPSHLSVSLILLGVSSVFSPAYAQLMLSQYIDGNNNNKGLELYNPDSSAVNLADYQIRQYTNGSNTVSTTYRLVPTGTTSLLLNPKTRYLLGHPNLKAQSGLEVDHVANLAFNGDDALVLYKGETPIDRFGQVGVQPPNGWGVATSSKGNSFSRIDTQSQANTIDPSQAFDLDQSWRAWADRNDFSNVQSGNSTPPTTTPPTITALSCTATTTPIADLRQAAMNQSYTVRGVITGDYRYQNGFSGFYLQTPDHSAKPNMSNAIFVYIPNNSRVQGGAVGQEVILKGRLTQHNNRLQLDQLDQHVNEIKTCQQNAQDLIKPIELQLPFDSLTQANQHSPQRYEGMWVTMPQRLTISENYNYGRFGELALSLGRLYIPTNLYPAQSAEAKALAAQNNRSKIILDDGYANQNRTPWLPQAFNAQNSLRTGYQLQNVQGILEFNYNAWRIQPLQQLAPPQIVTQSNPRQKPIPKQAEHIRVAAFNVLNYDNGADGFPTERGADSAAEYQRQHEKMVAALKQVDADVYGLMEIANNGYGANSALAALTKDLGSTWKYVIPTNQDRLGSDVIAVAIIYNAERVKPVNAPVVLDLGDRNRMTIAQSFQPIAGGKVFTVVPNHLKSKGSCDSATGLDLDIGDGQGCWNNTRVQAVEQLIQWLAKDPTAVNTPNTLILGDLNAYAKEDPILRLEQAGYTALVNDEQIGLGKDAYSYDFGVASNLNGYGGAGNLDHILSDQAIKPAVQRAFTWTVNADEPTALDYNVEFKSEQQITDFYAPDAYRSSDHDPIIVDLLLQENNAVETPTAQDSKSGSLGWISTVFLTLLLLFRRKQRLNFNSSSG